MKHKLAILSIFFVLFLSNSNKVYGDTSDCEISFPEGNVMFYGKSLPIRVFITPKYQEPNLGYYQSIFIKMGDGSWFPLVKDQNIITFNPYSIDMDKKYEWNLEVTTDDIPEGYIPSTFGILVVVQPRVTTPSPSYIHCGIAEFYINSAPTPTPIPIIPPPGVTYTPTPTPTPQQCPICKANYIWNRSEKKCCPENNPGCINSEYQNPIRIDICKPGENCYPGLHCGTSPLPTPTPTPIPTQTPEQEKLKALCDILPHTTEKDDGTIIASATEEQDKAFDSCNACVTGTNQKTGSNTVEQQAPFKDKSGSYTALGCFPTNLPDFFARYLWPYGLGIAGGIAFLLMLWGAFNILVSMGDPKRIEHGRELIVSAITGLLFIIFAVLILRIIGVDTLKIPGFG